MPFRTVRLLRHLALAIFISALTCVAGGCNFPQSVNPFYRAQDVVFDSSLLGEWQSADPSDKGGLLIKAKTADSYTIESTFYDQDRKSEARWTFEAHKFVYRQDSYLDFFPIAFRINGKTDNFQTEANGMFFLVPVHSLMRLQHDGRKLSLTWSEVDGGLNLFKKEDEASKEKRLAREKREHDILTMSTEQLQQEVLGPPPKGPTVSETEMTFIRKK
jgi:hypothetical protein